MLSALNIYTATGELRLSAPLTANAKLTRELMETDEVSLSFTLAQAVRLQLGDYIDFATDCPTEAERWHLDRYELTEPFFPTWNKATNGYEYSLTLKATYMKWANKIFKYLPRLSAVETSFSLNSTCAGFGERILENLEALGDHYKYLGVTAYSVEVGEDVSTEHKTLSFENVSLLDALSSIAEEYETEWWVDGSVLHFGKCALPTATAPILTLALGKEIATLSSTDSSEDYATRLYVFGSERNIPSRYRKELTFTSSQTSDYSLLDADRPLLPSFFKNQVSKDFTLHYDTQTYGAVDGDKWDFVDLGFGNEGMAFLCGGERLTFALPSEGITISCRGIITEKSFGFTHNSSTDEPIKAYLVGKGYSNSGKLVDEEVSVRLQISVSFPSKKMDNGKYVQATITKIEQINSFAYPVNDIHLRLVVTHGAKYAGIQKNSDKAYPIVSVSPLPPAVQVQFSEVAAQYATIVKRNTTYEGTLQADGSLGISISYTNYGSTTKKYVKFGLGYTFSIVNIITARVPLSYFTDKTDSSQVQLEVVNKRLMLPADTPYLDSDTDSSLPLESKVEKVVVFDEVYPRTNLTITAIATKRYTDDVEDETGESTPQTWTAYCVQVTGFEYAAEYDLASQDQEMKFTSGDLNGFTFTRLFNSKGYDPDTTKEGITKTEAWDSSRWFFEIKRTDEEPYLPQEKLCPHVGDTFVIIGWDPSYLADTSLITDAEQELLEEGKKYLKEITADGKTYTAELLPAYVNKLLDKETSPTSGLLPLLGQSILLQNETLFGTSGREGRVIGYSFPLYNPRAGLELTVGEKSSYSLLGSMREDMDSLSHIGEETNSSGNTIAGSGNSIPVLSSTDTVTPASNTNVFSALRSRKESLSRLYDDSAKGLITFEKGAELQGELKVNKSDIRTIDFGRSLQGFGYEITSSGDIYANSLTLRQFFEVPELRYNRVEVMLGDEWQAPGGGLIESCIPDYETTTDDNGNETITTKDTGTITLHLEDGEIGAVAVGDICMGYFHFADSYYGEDTDDGRGNITHAGFTTIYFKVTEITDTSGLNKTFRYQLRPSSDYWTANGMHPQAQMNFAAYGNFDNTSRQKSVLRTKTYTRYLSNVDNWEITSGNLMMQMGDLSNLSVLGMTEMTGYSAYLNNIYMTGTIEQLVNLPLRVEVSWSGGESLSSGESATATARLMKGFDDLSSEVLAWKVTRSSSDTAGDTTWNASHSYIISDGSPLELTLSSTDLGESVSGVTFSFLPVDYTADGIVVTDSEGAVLQDTDSNIIIVNA